MLKRYAAVWLLSLPLALTGCSSLFGDDEDGPYIAELQDIDAQFDADDSWNVSVGDGVGEHFSQLHPTVAYGKLFAADREGTVAAFDKQTGERVWHTHVGLVDEESWFDSHLPADVAGGLTAAYKKLFLGTEQGDVIALDVETGELLWRAMVGGEVLAAPAVDMGIVVVSAHSGVIYGLDAETGDERWQYKGSSPALTLRANSSPVAAQGAAFVGTADGKLSAIVIDKGFQAWEQQITTPAGANELDRMVDIAATPIIVGGTLYVVAYNGELAAIEMRTGQPAWKREYSSYRGFTIDGFDLYITDSSSMVVGLDRRNGGEKWVQSGLEGRAITTPAVVGDYVVVGDFEGYLHWLDRTDGQFVARDKVDGSGFYSKPVVDGDRFYIQARDGDIYTFDVPVKN